MERETCTVHGHGHRKITGDGSQNKPHSVLSHPHESDINFFSRECVACIIYQN
jgi:hypothetical protein